MPKRKRVSKSGPIWHKSAEEATLDKMPKFNAHACGTGPHGDLKYNRAKQKRNWQREFDQREARNCGLRPYIRYASKEPRGQSLSGFFRRGVAMERTTRACQARGGVT